MDPLMLRMVRYGETCLLWGDCLLPGLDVRHPPSYVQNGGIMAPPCFIYGFAASNDK